MLPIIGTNKLKFTIMNFVNSSFIFLFSILFLSLSCTKETGTGLVVGEKAPSFTDYENYSGGTTSLSDFEGQYVYIDIWATTCFPCLAQIIDLEKAKVTYKDKNIAFVSISIDKATAKKKWRSNIAIDEMTDFQLFADDSWDSQFIKDCQIKSIPRFILIDKRGNVVSTDAPYPSESEKLAKLFADIE